MEKTARRESVKSKKSFTLVEVIFTISIIGILLAILLPAMDAIKFAARKVKDMSNLKKIAEAWRECTINRGWLIDGVEILGVQGDDDNGTRKISVFMEQLAGLNQKNISDMVLNDSNVYISPGDKYASKLNYETITYFCTSGWQLNQIIYIGTYGPKYGALASTSNFMTTKEVRHISYCFVCGLSADVPLNTTPLGFTRGLREDGKWDERAGLYGSKGGYVVYCDGHVTWFDGDQPARFLKWDGSGYSSDIRDAVPGGTINTGVFITCSNKGIKTDYKSDNKLVILYHPGAGSPPST
ncbi:MAG: prepilin-type N-terminal cleavage/methylation domain-containing protein [Puniceicoccales bacterium]|jgi:prepilin-type processing-associated H-X9-DG protein|nr:prepilin-type N-terminal cleavage/methylation domain-containing protein [Puniceicoccales bacterium]